MTSSGSDVRDQVESAWRTLEGSWGDEAAHRRFLALCSATGQLGEAARRYRALSERDDPRSEDARRRLGTVLAAALSGLEAPRKPRKPARSRLFWLACGLLMGLAAYVLSAVLRQLSR